MFTEYENMLIEKSKLKIEKVIEDKGIENVAISFSGGKDSTVLKHLVESIEPSIQSVFCNTGVEYNAIVDFVKSFGSTIWIVEPKTRFPQVIQDYGYPVISKEQSRYIDDVRNPKCCQRIKDIRLGTGNFCISKKWKWLIYTNIKISDKCCYHLKKAPLKNLGYYYFTGERIAESKLRKQMYHTCILPNKCVPLRLWSDELIDKYIEYHNIKICDIYKHEKRTGCKFCLYGIQFEERPNRIDRLKILEPKSYNFAEKIGIVDLMEKILSHDYNKINGQISIQELEVV